MKKYHLFIVLLSIVVSNVCYADSKSLPAAPYGSSEFYIWPALKDAEELKVAFDFNFNDPAGVERALYPVSFMLKTIQEYGPVSFDMNVVVVSHGSEAVVWAKQNYAQYKDVIDRAARLSELGVQFEVCAVAVAALGFKPEDLHGFVRVVPLGTYALAYHASQGFAVIPGAATLPEPLINSNNSKYLGK